MALSLLNKQTSITCEFLTSTQTITGNDIVFTDQIVGPSGNFNDLVCNTLHYTTLDPPISGGSLLSESFFLGAASTFTSTLTGSFEAVTGIWTDTDILNLNTTKALFNNINIGTLNVSDAIFTCGIAGQYLVISSALVDNQLNVRINGDNTKLFCVGGSPSTCMLNLNIGDVVDFVLYSASPGDSNIDGPITGNAPNIDYYQNYIGMTLVGAQASSGPIFSVHLDANLNLVTSPPITITNYNDDFSSNFFTDTSLDMTTGVWTVPLTGKYLVSAQMYLGNPGTSIAIQVNSTIVAASIPTTTEGIATLAPILNLNSGDQVILVTSGGTDIYKYSADFLSLFTNVIVSFWSVSKL